MRITLLVALLGHRINEICLLDPDQLEPLLPTVRTDAARTALAIRPRRRSPSCAISRRISRRPEHHPLHAELVAIIRGSSSGLHGTSPNMAAPAHGPSTCSWRPI